MSIDLITKNMTDTNRPVFSISVAADMIGVSVHTLRMYESEGLVFPHRTASSRRLYSHNDLHRLRCIRVMLDERGLNIAGIKAMMSLAPCWEIKNCAQEDRMRCPAYHETTTPCWLIENKPRVCSEEECRECPVYTELTLCGNMKLFLKRHWKQV